MPLVEMREPTRYALEVRSVLRVWPPQRRGGEADQPAYHRQQVRIPHRIPREPA
jgi:hypothetical protein